MCVWFLKSIKMPKPQKNMRKRNLPSQNSRVSSTAKIDIEPTPKRKKPMNKPNCKNKVGKPKVLAQTLDNNPRKTRSTTKYADTRGSVNADVHQQQMPSLADLEKMFEDSEENQELPSTTSEESKISEQNLNIDTIKDDILSSTSKGPPKPLKKNASVQVSLDDQPPPLSIPCRNCKTNHTISRIVNCREPSSINHNSIIDLCNDETEGNDCINTNQANGQQNYLMRRNSCESSDAESNKAVFECEYNLPSSNVRTFSPLPSTSRDNATIQRNEECFSNSLFETSPNGNQENNVEQLQTASETIVIDEEEIPGSSAEVTTSQNENNNQALISLSNFIKKGNYIGQAMSNGRSQIIYVEEVFIDNPDLLDKIKRMKETFTFTTTLFPYVPCDQNNSTSHNSDPSTSEEASPEMKKLFKLAEELAWLSLVFSDDKKRKEPCKNCKVFQGKKVILRPTFLQELMENKHIFLKLQLSSSTQQNIPRSTSPAQQNIPRSTSSPQQNIPRSTTSAQQNIPRSTSSTQQNIPRSTPPESQTNPNTNDNSNTDHILLDSDEDSLSTNGTISPRNHYGEVLRNRPKVQYTAKGKRSQKGPHNPNKNLGDCPICLDNLSHCLVASTICGHVFCMKCIKAAVKVNGKKCPTCRMILKGSGYHPLFL